MNKRKYFWIWALGLFFLVGCSNVSTEAISADAMNIERTNKHHGATINPDNAITVAELLASMKGEKGEKAAKVIGPINGVCKVKGCWMTMDRGDGEDMRITFKDYGFFMPMDIDDNRRAVVEGRAKFETTPVQILRHLAEDAGESPEAIAQITEPKLELVFEADGVYLTK